MKRSEKLARIRKKLGESKARMAELIGIHPNSYQRIESGKRKPTRQQLTAAVSVEFIWSLGKMKEYEKHKRSIDHVL